MSFWTAAVKTLGTNLVETYQFTPSTRFTNVFDLVGQGTGYAVTGTVISTARGVLNASTTNAVMRSLAGKSKLATSLTLKGKDNASDSVSIKATKP